MKIRKIAVNLLTVIICLVFAFINSVSASSETPETERNITLGTSHIKNGQLSKVYFGRYPQSSIGETRPETGLEYIDWIKNTNATKNGQGPYYSKDPIKWRVLKNNGEKLFLLSDKNLDRGYYNTITGNITWERSTVRSWLNGYPASYNKAEVDYSTVNFIDTAFSLGEQNLIADTNVVNNIVTYWGVSGGNNTIDKIFFLSSEQVKNSEYGFVDNTENTVLRQSLNTAYLHGYGRYETGTTDRWWLRTPGIKYQYLAVAVDFYGRVPASGVEAYYYKFCYRPALNLDVTSVLFTSGTDSGYALTFKDQSRYFTVSDTSEKIVYPGIEISFDYQNAVTGSNEYISAIIADSDDNVVKYIQLSEVTLENDNVVVEIPSCLEAGEYVLKLFNEKYNGEEISSYSSDFVDVPLTVKNKPEFKILSCSIADNKTVATVSVPKSGKYNIIFADYEGGKVSDFDIVPVTVTEDKTGEITQMSNKEILLESGDKIMLWNDISDIMPVCEAFNVE